MVKEGADVHPNLISNEQIASFLQYILAGDADIPLVEPKFELEA